MTVIGEKKTAVAASPTPSPYNMWNEADKQKLQETEMKKSN